MKELQAYYKIKTSILHNKIKELKVLISDQNKDIQETKSFYTDELVSLKDDIFQIRNMGSKLEII